MKTEHELEIAIRAARKAGEIMLERFGKAHDIAHKGTVDLVTEADRLAEEAIIGLLEREFPGYGILSEEASPDAAESDARWVIDPLDGTTNYARGFPHFGTSIALELNGEVALGVVYNPLLDELFTAQRGKGATLNGKPIHVSGVAELGQALLSSGTPYDVWERPDVYARPWDALTVKTLAMRQSGSAALDFCYVAMGRTDAHFEVDLSPWDVAAGCLIVMEAGGKVTDYKGNPFSIHAPDFFASNGILHELIMQYLQW